MATRTYDPKQVMVSFFGQILGGFADGTFVTAERTEDSFQVTVGASGEGARTKSNNKSGTVTLTLLASSQTNDILAAIAATDELSGAGIGPLFIKEFNGTSLAIAANAWLKKLPSMERGKELGQVEWLFECESLELFSGGLV